MIRLNNIKIPLDFDFSRLDKFCARKFNIEEKNIKSVKLVCRDAHIVERVFLFLESVDLFIYQVRFELSRTPADADTRPAVAVGRDA